MKVLFVGSGNKSGGVGIIVQNQGQSIINQSVEVDFFPIIGKGIFGYLKNVFLLRKYLKGKKYDVVHAHYSLSAFVATLAGCKPLIVSLMGSDTYLNSTFRIIIRFFALFFWNTIIVKSEKMKESLHLKNAKIIPNGVDTSRFKPIDQKIAREKLNYKGKDKLIVFIADPSRYEKNYTLALQAVELLNDSCAELLPVYNVPNNEISYYMNAADVLLLTSRWEGSVNVVKEAMACNLPVVSTDVGDVRQNTNGLEGYYLSDHIASELADNLKKALLLDKGQIKGRERLIALGLDSETVANEMIQLYKTSVTV
jgi:teichuronic acid biosynthesis glycosyltransferase TuaC